jgi:NADPH:quinone reductase-like Zn-dependent oxidoreductase
MRAWIVPAGCTSLDELRMVERPEPAPGPGQVVVRVRAASLNYRDQAVVRGQYFGGATPHDLVPLSDGAGDVVAVGAGMTAVAVGDRVAGTFFQPGPQGPAALGSPLDGVLSELAVFADSGVVKLPDALGYEAGACLPCAGVTAWHALFVAGRPIVPGETVLVLGTGGVSMLALQLARAAGARVVATSSSDDKLARAVALGATDTINYARTPQWDQEVLRVTGGRGVDCVVEIGGAGTLARSFQSLARGGKVALIGFLGGPQGETAPHPLMTKGGSLYGIFVGDRPMFEALLRAVTVNRIMPPVDRVFAFEEVASAYAYQAAGAFGKVVIRVTP